MAAYGASHGAPESLELGRFLSGGFKSRNLPVGFQARRIDRQRGNGEDWVESGLAAMRASGRKADL
jgi:hypothetical protein